MVYQFLFKMNHLTIFPINLENTMLCFFYLRDSTCFYPFNIIDLAFQLQLILLVDFDTYIIFMNHYNRFTWIYLIEYRYEFLQYYHEFWNMTIIQFLRTIKIFRYDNAIEFTDYIFITCHFAIGWYYSWKILSRYISIKWSVLSKSICHILDITRSLLLSLILLTLLVFKEEFILSWSLNSFLVFGLTLPTSLI